MKDAGGLFSIVLNVNTLDEVEKFCNSLKHILLAVSWGGHESLAIPSAVGFSPNEFDKSNANHRLVRLYVGLEDPDYLIADLKQALEK
jgi:cystathionine beta-lyase/cystathionine gamma-synthase